jgi:adenylate cyclase class IV
MWAWGARTLRENTGLAATAIPSLACKPGQAGPKESFYLITATTEPHRLRAVLAAAHGIVGRVTKHRTLVLAGRTRIHLDRVKGLGEFLELEVVLAEHESPADGVAEAHALMAHLGVSPDRLIEDAYLDMLKRQGVA